METNVYDNGRTPSVPQKTKATARKRSWDLARPRD